MKRLLVVQQYRPPGSFQDRQRGPMYAPLLRKAGFEPRFIGRHPMPPLQAPEGRIARAVSRSLAVRAFGLARDRLVTPMSDAQILALAPRFDVILLVKVDSPAFVRRLRQRTKARLVYDLADSIWRAGPGKTRPDVLDMLRSVDAITVDNAFGMAFARQLGPPVHEWPSASYVEAFDAARASSRRDKDGKVVLGWLGSHTTVSNLYLILESLEDIAKRHPHVEVRLLGVPAAHDLLGRFERVRATSRSMYSTEDMVREVLDMDIGLYPMYDLEDCAMHGVTKGVIYMAGGAVVVASPIGDCRNLVEEGVNGFLASGRQAWTDRLDLLVRDTGLRARLRQSALDRMRTAYSLESCFVSMRPALGE